MSSIPTKPATNGLPSPTATPSKAASHPLIDEMSPSDFEAALHETYDRAKKLAWKSDEATPEALTAILAMYAIQEVHACGYRPPSAIRAMVKKMKAQKSEEKLATITALRDARRELIKEVREAKAAKAEADEAGKKEENGKGAGEKKAGGEKLVDVDGGVAAE